MFSSVDSKTYLGVADYIYSGKETPFIRFRPFFYPFVLGFLLEIGGAYAVVLFQAVLWLITMNLIYHSIKILTGSGVFSFFGGLIFLSNFSLIALTFHGLTEVTTTFFLAFLTFILLMMKEKIKNLSLIHICLFLLSLLTITKPVFSLPLYFLFFFSFLFHFPKYIKHPKNFLFLLFALLPIIIQGGIMKYETGKTQISEVSAMALKEYILPQVMQKVEGIDRLEAEKRIRKFTVKEKIDFFLKNKSEFVTFYFGNIKTNVHAFAHFLQPKNGFKTHYLYEYMNTVNRIYYYIHFLFFPIFVLSLYELKKKGKLNDFFMLSVIYVLFIYLITVTGISFWQGDRLVLPTIAIWPILYCFSLFQLCIFLLKKYSCKI